MNSPPNSGPPTQVSIDFGDRNAVERFLEGKKFRRCTNLRCESVSPSNMQMLYMPICTEGRFAREGFAQHIEMPLHSRPLNPITYTTIPQWAPLISCPSDCRGYQNRTVARLRAMFRKQPHATDSRKSLPKWDWKWWAATFVAVAAIVIALVQPEVRIWLGLDKPKPAVPPSAQGSQPQTAPMATPFVPEAKTVAKPHAKPKPTSGEHQSDTATQINAPQGIAIGGNATVTNPTVNNFGPPEPNVTWTQEKGNSTADKKATVVVTLRVDHSFEIPAFLAQCDRPCETVGATAPGYSQASYLNVKQNPNMAGFVFKAPRPLGSGLPVEWTIKSEDDQPFEVKSVEKVPPDKLPPELR